MPYLDRLNRVCGFLDIEEKENSCRFQRRYFILDTPGNVLQWYMDNPQNLAREASFVGSLKLTYISKVSEATPKQKPKTEFCFVINAVSRRYFLQANDVTDMKEWVNALNKASKITVPKSCPTPAKSESNAVITDSQGGRKQHAYKAEIIGGVVVHTPIQNEPEDTEGREKKGNRPGVLRCGFCVKQGNVRKSWKRRFFTLDDSTVSYYKTDTDKEPLRGIPLRDIQKVHECLVKSGDLLFRDNLFEIITNSRTFYIQTDTPEEMHGWIRDIETKIREFRGPPRGYQFKRVSSLHQKQNASGASRLQSSEMRPQLVKSCSVAPGWQPWTPVPPGEPSIVDMDDEDSPFSPVPTRPSLSSSSTSSSTSSSSNSLTTLAPCPSGSASSGLVMLTASADIASGRRRHRSQPQPHSAFPFSLDDDGIRTTDV
ncbi:pleckstrin homology domain-containing family A member 2 [Cyprinodon tularosa]|uniref:pleckstrin homology domain-containing family A member 2 n=1 Tax=Cyprinodon tularosa TaxID=77115 RepID=UPI0018E1F677|nr:pleckstrin homology domain-containing family A member 2 [Cyprinodon tularosa]